MSNHKRTFSPLMSLEIKKILQKLNDKSDITEYKKNMFLLGMDLGNKIVKKHPRTNYFYLVCTVEDADFLAKGIMESLKLNNKKFNLSCFWNSREKAGELGRISPVVRKYVEPYSPPNKQKGKLIVVKSLISGACVVKTNIKEVISKIDPSEIIITAPIMHIDARKKLESEFGKNTTKKFDYFYYAKDYYKNSEGLVQPGLGDVYKLLGLKSQKLKNKYTPLTVKERRSYYLK